MIKTSIPLKVAIGYSVVALVLIMAIWLVYSNTKSILAINQASSEYIRKRDAADSLMTCLLTDEQTNLKQLSDALNNPQQSSFLLEKMNNLKTGKDSVIVAQKTAQTHEEKNITVEVAKTRKGFFHRLADVFRKERAETLCVKKDSNQAIIDTIAPVNVAKNVAGILEQIDKKEQSASKINRQALSKEMAELQMISAQMALRSAQQLNEAHKRECESMQQTINRAMQARQHLLWQIALLAVIAILAALILLYYIRRDSKKECIYRENLEQANKEIRRIMQQRERLLLTITHDIKAPAASISGFIDLLKDDVANERGRSYLQSMQNSATHLSQLVTELLDYHQLENGLMEKHPVSFCPQKLVAQCAEEMKMQSEQKGLALYCETQGCELFYRADAFRIRQILYNLVSNAIKYTEAGSISIHAHIGKNPILAETPYSLVLKVADTGRGLTQEESRRIFQAFTRLEETQGIEGTGLGLSITQELTRLLGGTIQLESEKGKGSTFTVILPMSKCEEDEQQERAPKTLNNNKVLILDDDKLQLQLLQEMVHRISSDWKVFACNHISEALTLLHNEHPALMMMDIEMPEMNGIEMLKHINHSNMKVIAMTAHDSSIKEKLLQEGFDDCLFKPFTMEILSFILLAGENVVPSKENENHRLENILAFAGDDAEGARNILQTVKQELETYITSLTEVQKTEPLSTDRIGKIVHKLLPIATMLKLEHIKELKSLSSGHIQELDIEKIREYLQVVISNLQDILHHSLHLDELK